MKNLKQLPFCGGVLLALTTLVACTEAAPTGSGRTVRDSAGIQIWEYETLSRFPLVVWKAEEEPALTLGEEVGDDPFLFSMIQGVVPLLAGMTAVADGLSSEVRIFDEKGRHFLTVGGSGSGPGEFDFLGGIFPFRADSLVATNLSDNTFSVFGPEGQWGRAGRFQPGPETPTGLLVQATLSDGSFLVRAMQRSYVMPTTLGYRRDLSTYQVFNENGSPGPVLSRLPGGEYQVVNRDGRQATLRYVMGRNAVSTAIGDQAFLGVTDRLEVWRYESDGSLSGILRVQLQPEAPDAEVRDLWINHSLRNEESPEAIRRIRVRLEDRPLPDSLPVISDLRGDDEGNLWIGKFVPEYEDGPSEWWVFSSDGKYLADARLPAGVSVRHIGSDFILGVTVDELGVERVVRYALEKG